MCFFSGGVIVILEKIVSATEDGPLCPMLMDLVMLLSTPGKERTLAQYNNLLTNSGFRVTASRADSEFNWYDVIIGKADVSTQM